MTTAERTDLRNAELLVSHHQRDLRHVCTWAKWLRWTGARWEIDERAGVQECAANTVRTMFDDGLEALRLAQHRGDSEAFKRAQGDVAWASKSHGAPRIAAMVALAKSNPSIVVQHHGLDADPWLLNVANGTLDLRAGKLRPHRREDLITKLAPVAFNPEAKCPTWDAFLSRAMGESAELVDFLARLTGYALTGDVREHVLAFFFGGGANGKSTFLSTVHAMLGDYASPAPRGLLFRSRGERHPTEYASLHGRRFVTCSEIEDGQAFDEALVKDLTGGDPIECRRMREDFWSFQPTHKLFLAGNHKPTVRGDDEGIWRRMRLVPWTVTIPEADRDKALLEKLRRELPGILAWSVRGCLAWQANGLGTPSAVRDATAAYRGENDTLGEFFGLRVAFDPTATVVRKDLREAYEGHCRDNGAEPFGAKRFASRLKERGVVPTCVRTASGPRDGWRGVRLMNDAERTAAAVWTGHSDVVTSRDRLPVAGEFHVREGTNRKLHTTSHDAPTVGDEPTFADWIESE